MASSEEGHDDYDAANTAEIVAALEGLYTAFRASGLRLEALLLTCRAHGHVLIAASGEAALYAPRLVATITAALRDGGFINEHGFFSGEGHVGKVN